jgi:hypothetical protein
MLVVKLSAYMLVVFAAPRLPQGHHILRSSPGVHVCVWSFQSTILPLKFVYTLLF